MNEPQLQPQHSHSPPPYQHNASSTSLPSPTTSNPPHSLTPNLHTPSPLAKAERSTIDGKLDPEPRFIPPPLPASRNIDRVRKSLLEQKAAIERGLREIADLEEKQHEDEEFEVDGLFRDLTTSLSKIYIFRTPDSDQGQDQDLQSDARRFVAAPEAEQYLEEMKELETRLKRLPSEQEEKVAIKAEEVQLEGKLTERQRKGVAKANQRFVHSLRGIRARRAARAGERRKVSPSGVASTRTERKEQVDLSSLEETLQGIKAAGRKAAVRFDVESCMPMLRQTLQREPEMLRGVRCQLDAILHVLEAATLFRQRKNVAAARQMKEAVQLWATAASCLVNKETRDSTRRPDSSCSSSFSSTPGSSRPSSVSSRQSRGFASPIPFDAKGVAFCPGETESDVASAAMESRQQETNYCKLVLYCLRTSKSAGLFLSESISREMDEFLQV